MNFYQLSFGVFGLKIYGMLLAFAFVVALWHYYKTLQKQNFPMDFFRHNFWHWLVGGLLVGRVVALILEPSIIAQHGMFSLFAFWDGTVHFWGVLAGFLGTMWWTIKDKNIPFLRWLDQMVVPLFIGLLIVDIAMFLTGAVYGRETILPWGIQYETFGVDLLKPTHPVSIYAFIAHLIAYSWLRKHIVFTDRFPGRLIFFAGVAFFAIDFLVQFFRGDSTVQLFGVIRIEQLFDFFALIFFFLWHKGLLPLKKV
jgi:phosphatidylglycerol---prolipoprotein diacylglyceryl transferase